MNLLKELPGRDIDQLSLGELQFIYEAVKYPAGGEMQLGSDGALLIFINDDCNPPGWYEYRQRDSMTTASLREFAYIERERRIAALGQS